MLIAWQDRTSGYIYPLARERGESQADYVARFFRSIRGLGMCHIVTGNGKWTRVRRRASRGL